MRDSLRLEKISKHFRKKEVLSSLSFTVEEGITFAFLGENGAGKSTALEIMASVLRPSSGTYYVNDKDPRKEEQDIKNQIGTVFQEDVLDHVLTVYQNLYYRGGLYLSSNQETEARIEAVLQALDILGLKQETYGELSVGKRRLVQIARALIGNPRILLLDEPTAGLDIESRSLVWKRLKELQRRQKLTIFYTTHYTEELFYADRIGRLKNGTLCLEESSVKKRVRVK